MLGGKVWYLRFKVPLNAHHRRRSSPKAGNMTKMPYAIAVAFSKWQSNSSEITTTNGKETETNLSTRNDPLKSRIS